MRRGYESGIMDTLFILYILAEAVVSLTSAVGNAIVLAAILRTRRLHTVTNVFIGGLAVADIAVGLAVPPMASVVFTGRPRNFYGCILVHSLILLFTNVSVFMLLAVAVERFIAIKKPFMYQRLLTIRRAVMINVAVWLLGTALGLVPLYGWNTGNYNIKRCTFLNVMAMDYMVYFQFFGVLLVPLSLMLGIYTYIFIIIRRHSRQTYALHKSIRYSVKDEKWRKASNFTMNRILNNEVRVAKMFVLLITLFCLFWLPINILNCLIFFCPKECKFSYEALVVALVMSHANSSINPLICATNNSSIKKAIKVMFGCSLSENESFSNVLSDSDRTSTIYSRIITNDSQWDSRVSHQIFTVDPMLTLKVEKDKSFDKQKPKSELLPPLMTSTAAHPQTTLIE
ncbi:adenosine receptor A1-like [Elysia marginata]|uniref:Adenosine receptor A1-like n=1 Tax=Elysia marginata TaxID=1093978 RepID=A0AAV4F4W8_9GAST|nr:adenosine receptor A1-like [Elysia marginata]